MRYIPYLVMVPAIAIPLCAWAGTGAPVLASPPGTQTANHHIVTKHDEDAHYEHEIHHLSAELATLRARAAVQEATLSATQRPQTARAQGAATVYQYLPNSIYEVYAAPDNTTDIELDPGEKLTAVNGGDTVRWILGTTTSGQGDRERWHVLLKPVQSGLQTSLVITTDRRTYHVIANSTRNWFMPAVAWDYPHQAALALAHLRAARAAERQQVVTTRPIAPSNLNFSYRIAGDDYPWKPLRAFDDGAKTYIQFPPQMSVTEAPALFVGAADHLQLVNYRVQGDYFIVDRLFDNAVLRVGVQHQVEIHKVRRGHHWWQFASSANETSD